MGKLHDFIRRLLGGSFKRMLERVNIIHSETGKNRPVMIIDMLWCIFRYGIGYRDYQVFGFYAVYGNNRKTFLTYGKNTQLSRCLNSPEHFDIFDDKALFNEKFSQFVRRGWIDLRKADVDEFKRFCRNLTCIFAKPLNDFGGHGILREFISDSTDLEKMYYEFLDKNIFLIEEPIIQHEKMRLLSKSSVNTLRIVTVFNNGKVHFLYAVVRMAVGDTFVDNTCSGGLYAPIDESGTITGSAFRDSTGEFYSRHPNTDTEICGFEIPMFDKALEMCKQAGKVCPQVGYVGWDIAITPDGPVIIEGNTLPNYSLCQNYHFTNGVGILPKLYEILGADFFKRGKSRCDFSYCETVTENK